MESSTLALALSQPWLLARVAASALALALLLGAVLSAARLRGPDDRRVELVASLLGAALRVELGALALHVLAAQALVNDVPGAMCAYGVVHASPWGPRSVAAALVAALACAAGAGVSAVDARLRYGSARGALRVALLGALAATAWDLRASASFAATLDLDVAVSCCTREVAAASAGAGMGARGLSAGPLVGGLAALSSMISIVLGRRHVVASMAIALPALPLAAWTTRDLLGPWILGHVDHRCLYCAAASLPFGALAVAALLALALLLARGAAALALRRAHPAESAAVLAEASSRARWAQLAWIVAASGAALTQVATRGTLTLR